MTDGAIIIDGEKYVIPGVEVRTWHDTGLTFGHENVRPRRLPISLCTLHWIGAEREGIDGAAQLHRNLVARGLSVEFGITNEGAIWQFVDPAESRCSHASRVNDVSVGVEVSNVGHLRRGKVARGATALRDQYYGDVHGWHTTWLDYLPAQHKAVEGLVRALIDALGLSRHVFTDPFIRRTTRDLTDLGGTCGHLHAASWAKEHPKCDPGPRPLILLDEALKRDPHGVSALSVFGR